IFVYGFVALEYDRNVENLHKNAKKKNFQAQTMILGEIFISFSFLMNLLYIGNILDRKRKMKKRSP
ncbi:hypothetical protein ACJX0J_024039, partial [Zea mays]